MGPSGKQLLVTGASGYLGSILCEHLLRDGYSVTALDNLMYGQHTLFHLCAKPRFEFVRGDARDESLLKSLVKQADVIIPLAAIVGAGACDRDPWLTKSVNLEAIQLLNRIRSRQQVVIFPMTNSGYGTKSGESYCTEETPLEPISLYGQTKVDAEKEILNSANTISLRLATVFGMSPRMRMDLLVNQFVHAAVTGGYLVLFEKDCMLHCIQNSERMVGRPYNAGLDGANLSKEELALKIKEYVPNLYIHAAAIGSDPDKRNYIVSNQRLRSAGFEAKRTLDDGIKELLKGYRMLGRGAFQNV
jgi:nucleoside-diphosphate-sugar epimerase